MDILGLLLSIAFNTIAVVLVWKTNDMWVDYGVILLQVFFILYQIYKEVENKQIMKKFLICLIALCAVCMVSCENYTTRVLGGSMTIDVEPGYKVTNATFKETEVWYFVEPMDSEYVPKQKKFIEKSMYGIAEGVIIFNETRQNGNNTSIERSFEEVV